MRKEADNCFEQSLRIIPLSDEMLQRQFRGQLQERWNQVTNRIVEIESAVRKNISSEEVSVNEKLNLLERELHELRMTIEGFHGVLKTEEELELYVERLSVLFDRVCVIQVRLPSAIKDFNFFLIIPCGSLIKIHQVILICNFFACRRN